MEQLRMARTLRSDEALPEAPLPPGFTLRAMRDEAAERLAWSRCCLGGGLGVDEVGGAAYDAIMGQDETVAPERVFFAVAEDGEVVGTASLQLLGEGRGQLHNVAVAEAYRGRGLARPLCRRVLEAAQAYGVTHIALTTDDHRLAAIRSYLACGFEPQLDGDAALGARWEAVLARLGGRRREALR